jgi:uncharacterized protein with HEPN domain
LAEKTLRTDIEILRKIMKHQMGINETLEVLKLKSLNEIVENNVALKALALDVGQIGELADKLTKDTVDTLVNMDVKLAYSIRNRIDHAYLSVKPMEIALTAMQLGSQDAINETRNRIKYCVENCNQ